MRNQEGRSDKARFVSPATFDRLRCTEIFEGDCLVSRLPDPVGRACILPATGERMITAVNCTIIRF
jgi:type I restriction enzyme S subunit